VKRFAGIVLLSALEAHAGDIRIEVMGLFRPTVLTVRAAGIETAGERFVPHSAVEVRAGGDNLVTRVGGREIRGARLAASGSPVRVSIDGKISRSYEGRLEITAHEGVLSAVVTMDPERAVAAVTASEMPHGSFEAMKAMAVAARSYYSAGHRHNDFDFCDTTHCQLLKEATREAESAAGATRGEVLVYRGSVVRALYFSSCGGHTFAATDVGMDGGSYPFFAVACETCARHPEQWEARLPVQTVERGEAARLELARRFGWNRVASNDYTWERGSSGVILRGKGHGHGVGLCQRGAEGMARGGQGFAAILEHYFPVTSIRR
jgi:stage II sporulation protein D